MRAKTKDANGRESDEHFAERLFVEEVYVPIFGVVGLSYLTPQAPFVDGEGRRRRVDFLLNTGKKYAIEIEGRSYHSSAFQDDPRFNDEKARQRELSRAGMTYFPFTFADLRSGQAEAILNELSFEDRVLHRLSKQQRSQAAQVEPGAAAVPSSTQMSGNNRANSAMYPLDHLLRNIPEHFQAYQRALLALLSDASSAGQSTVTLVDYEPVTPLLALAVMDTISFIERVSELYNAPVRLPEIRVMALRPQDPELYQRVLAAYPLAASTFPDAPRSLIRLETQEQLFSLDGVTALFAGPGTKDPPSEAVTPAKLERISAKFVSEVGNIPPLDATPVQTDRQLLDYFARRYFTVPELKEQQAQLVLRALSGQSGLGILPTGFGKSLVFQLYAMMVPRTVLVISPLKALIRDQVHAMHRLGLSCVEAITSADSSAIKDRKLAEFRAHRYRLLYISPERLQIKAFYEELRATMQQTPVGAFVIDEAHCVSEWGHDFRPAYLQIGALRVALQQASARPIPILALTATASDPVRRDILSVLRLDSDSVIQLSSSDRPNLSLSVHAVDGQSRTKDELLEDLIRNTIPRVLKKPFEQLMPLGESENFQDAGVVFGIYANPHGRGTLNEGVHAIAKVLVDRVTHDRDLVRIHASTAPTVCPECDSQLYLPMSASERKLAGFGDTAGNRCLMCGHVFVRSKTPPDWETQILQNQDDFQNNAFPLLVATKGYGMGIDKQNLRYIVHHALSSGLEGYYQEAGRAGRDGRHSHVALTYAPPTSSCIAEYLAEGEPPPCVSEKGNYAFHKCPYGLSTLCDYGKQARFIRGSYAGVDEDLERVDKVYEALSKGETIAVDEWKDEAASRQTQLSLYRLQQLGVVRGYSLKYLSLTRIEFVVDFLAQWQPEDVVAQLGVQLRRTGYVEKTVETVLAPLQIRRQRRRVGVTVGDPRSELLKQALKLLLGRVYDTVPKMRYQMLRNQLEYATSTKCRRIIIRSIFDSDEYIPGDDYRCGFCDVCEPSLDLKVTQAAIPMRDAQVEDMARMLPDLLRAFETNDLKYVVKTAVNRGAVSGLYARVSNRLERDSTNLSALYLSGSLARRRPDRQRDAMQHLKRGFHEGTIQGLQQPELLMFSEEASQVDKHEGFHLLTPVRGPFNTDEGLELIENQARKLFGTDAQETRTVNAVQKTRRLARTASKVMDSLESPLHDLMAGFDDLDALMNMTTLPSQGALPA